MAAGNLAGNREPEAGAVFVVFGACAVEAFKYMRQLFRGNAAAVVANCNLPVAAGFLASGFDAAAGR